MCNNLLVNRLAPGTNFLDPGSVKLSNAGSVQLSDASDHVHPFWSTMLATRRCCPLLSTRTHRHGRSVGTSDLLGLGGEVLRFDSKTLQSPVGCLDIFDQILKRWNLIVCGPELRSGPNMQRDYGPVSPTRIREMRLHPLCCSHGWSRIRLFFRDHYLLWLRTRIDIPGNSVNLRFSASVGFT
jgi:hypothetical protein